METVIIITLCALLLSAYLFDITSSKTKIPSVILLLLLGFIVKRVTDWLDISIPDLTPLLPFLGTIGLILIVLEGALELEFNRSKLTVLKKTSLLALLPMLCLAFLVAAAFSQFGSIPFKNALACAIPFAVISSAIAIPSAANLMPSLREYVIYESSLSDIFGVLFFNFIVFNDELGLPSVGYFVADLIVTLLITFVATLALAFLISKIKHHVKFVPIIISVILVYEISKLFHLPGLIFILLFGLFLGNLDELKHIPFIQKLHPEMLNDEMHKFRELTGEIAFLVRGLFFLLFGFLIQTSELLNAETFVWAIAIVAGIFAFRYLFLRIFKLPTSPLLWIAPRGLITILLFLTIPATQLADFVNESLVIQVIILTALAMMFGLMSHKNEKNLEI